jgi:hypothetical protein
MGHAREVFPQLRDLCADVLEGELSLEDLRTALPEDACTDPFLGVVREDLERGISEIPRSRFLAQDNDRFLDIRDGYDELDGSLPRNREPRFGKLMAGLYFWDSWSDAAEHVWHHYVPSPDQWSALARDFADRLEKDEELPEHILQVI